MLRLLLVVLLSTLLLSCTDNGPVRIGFIGSISGKAAEVSQAARNGVILAVEQVNRDGGINGRQIDLVIFDDKHEPTTTVAAVNALADAGAVAIVGPIISQMAVAAVPVANQRKIVLVSPTSSTTELTGKEDYFYRVYPPCDENARRLATYAYNTMGLRRAAILYDLSNQAFTDPWQAAFTNRLEELGGTVVSKTTFSSLPGDFSFQGLTKAALEKAPDGLLILANSFDTALFSQQVRKLGGPEILLGSDWAFSGDLISYGGTSIEHFTFTTIIDMDNDAPAFLEFEKNYVKRFTETPKFPAVLGYESILAIVRALAANPDPTALPQTLIDMGRFASLQDTIQFDIYGETSRPTYVNEVSNGEFISLSRIE